MERAEITYFQRAGDHTEQVVEVLKRRLAKGDVRTVVVATDSGATALRVATAVGGMARVLAIAHTTLGAEVRLRLEELGTVVRDGLTPALDRDYPGMNLIWYRRGLRALGQGLKVAVEVTLMATDEGLIVPGEEVLAVGGTSRGADTVALVKAAVTRDLYSADPDRRVEVSEVVAMPKIKGW